MRRPADPSPRPPARGAPRPTARGAAPTEPELARRRLAAERGNRFTPGGPRVALLYPSPYRAGMSSLGFQWVLHLLREAGFSAERAFLPDDADAPGAERMGVHTYEGRSPVGRFPVIGVSLAYELELAGLVTALRLAGIPPLAADRGPHDPVILIGGPLTFSNPLPAAPFADAMLLGEVEDVVVDAFSTAYDLAMSGRRADVGPAIARLAGGYALGVHGSRLPPIAKASDARLPARGPILAPEAELSDMFLIEGERGCHRQCTFCVMRRSTNGGMRLVGADAVLGFVPDEAKRVGLVGAAISDHPQLPELLSALVGSGREVGLSSLRADRVARKPEIARLLRAGGATTLTVASDAPSQRLRREISKGTTEAHLIDVAKQAAEHKFRQLKVYMMVGLPGETSDDLDELVRFTAELAAIHPVALGVAPFVPKHNTPMAGAPFAGVKVVEAHLKRLQEGLRRETGGRAELRPTSARWAWVEHQLAQAGPEAAGAVLAATAAGGAFSAWRSALDGIDARTTAPWRVAPGAAPFGGAVPGVV